MKEEEFLSVRKWKSEENSPIIYFLDYSVTADDYN